MEKDCRFENCKARISTSAPIYSWNTSLNHFKQWKWWGKKNVTKNACTEAQFITDIVWLERKKIYFEQWKRSLCWHPEYYELITSHQKYGDRFSRTKNKQTQPTISGSPRTTRSQIFARRRQNYAIFVRVWLKIRHISTKKVAFVFILFKVRFYTENLPLIYIWRSRHGRPSRCPRSQISVVRFR